MEWRWRRLVLTARGARAEPAVQEERLQGTPRLVLRPHIVPFTVSALAIVAGILGAHGALY